MKQHLGRQVYNSYFNIFSNTIE